MVCGHWLADPLTKLKEVTPLFLNLELSAVLEFWFYGIFCISVGGECKIERESRLSNNSNSLTLQLDRKFTEQNYNLLSVQANHGKEERLKSKGISQLPHVLRHF